MDPFADAAVLVSDCYLDVRWALHASSVLDDPARTAGSDPDVVVCLPDGGIGHRDSIRWRGRPVEVFANTQAGQRWFVEAVG